MSLFGNNANSVFNIGAAPTTPQRNTTSLFGNSNTTSLFGNNQSGGLFSNNNNNNTLGGGLFGNNNQQNQGGSLFSNNNSNTNIFKSSNTTSLFQFELFHNQPNVILLEKQMKNHLRKLYSYNWHFHFFQLYYFH